MSFKTFDVRAFDILVSCYGDPEHERFGLVRIRNGKTEVLDGLSSTGLAVSVSGKRIYRLMRHKPYITGNVQELVIYESESGGKTGALSLVYHGISDPHDVFVHEGSIYVVSAGTNEIVRLDEKTFKETDRIKFAGDGNAWHINCIGIIGGRLCISAFNECADDFGWRNFPTKGAGFIMDVETGEKIWEGLSMPHNPTERDGITAVCDSESGSVLIRNAAGHINKAEFGGFTRGLDFSNGYMFVGISTDRKSPENAKICVYDMSAGETACEILLPFPEVYSVVLLNGKGFDGEIPAVNDLFREKDAEIEKLKSALSDAGARSLIIEQAQLDCPGAGRLDFNILLLDIPETMKSGAEYELPVIVENRSDSTIQSIDPYPVYLSYHWKKCGKELGLCEDDGYLVFDGIRTPFLSPLFHFSSLKMPVRVKAPDSKETYILEITMVQEHRFWFESACKNLPIRLRVTVI